MASFEPSKENYFAAWCARHLNLAHPKIVFKQAVIGSGRRCLCPAAQVAKLVYNVKSALLLKARQEISSLAFQLEQERKQKRQHLLQTEKSIDSMIVLQAQFMGLVASTTDHIFMLDGTGRYMFSNDRVHQFGLQRGDELLGRRLQDVYPSDVAGLYQEKLQDVIRNAATVTFPHQKITPEEIEYHINFFRFSKKS